MEKKMYSFQIRYCAQLKHREEVAKRLKVDLNSRYGRQKVEDYIASERKFDKEISALARLREKYPDKESFSYTECIIEAEAIENERLNPYIEEIVKENKKKEQAQIQSSDINVKIQELEAEKTRLEQLKRDLEEKELQLRVREESFVQKENELNNKPKTKSLFRRIFKR